LRTSGDRPEAQPRRLRGAQLLIRRALTRLFGLLGRAGAHRVGGERLRHCFASSSAGERFAVVFAPPPSFATSASTFAQLLHALGRDGRSSSPPVNASGQRVTSEQRRVHVRRAASHVARQFRPAASARAPPAPLL
jgi:hypothetical protein